MRKTMKRKTRTVTKRQTMIRQTMKRKRSTVMKKRTVEEDDEEADWEADDDEEY